LAERYELRVVRLIDPTATLNEFAMKVTQMRDRSAEGNHAQFQECTENFGDTRSRWRIFAGRSGWRGHECAVGKDMVLPAYSDLIDVAMTLGNHAHIFFLISQARLKSGKEPLFDKPLEQLDAVFHA
jgi:hypothetical protein